MTDVSSFILFGIDWVRFAIDFGIILCPLLVVSLTLNLEAGYAGIPNFGKVMFVAGGAAVSGSVCGLVAAIALGINIHGNYIANVPSIVSEENQKLPGNPLLAIELFLLGIVLAAGVGAGLGLVASYPAIRLREDYLGMLLLGSAQLFQIFLSNYEPLIGASQPIGVPNLFLWVPQCSPTNGFPFYQCSMVLASTAGRGWRDLAALAVIATFAGLVFLLSERLVRSPLGRTLRAVRDNEVAARSLGKDDVAIRRKVIVLASAISGIAGAMITFYYSSVGAGTWDRVAYTFWPWVMVIIGGAANNLGVVTGSALFALALKGLDQVKFQLGPILPVDVNYLELVLFASVLILIIIFRPQGVVPEKSSLTLPAGKLRAIMEKKPDITDDK